MNIVKNDKLVLINEFGKLKTVGQTYEVANFTDTAVVLRDAVSKVAVCAVDIASIDTYFKKVEEARSWTRWIRIVNATNDVIAFYRTNQKKVQVRTLDGFRADATCRKDEPFNLAFGIYLAYARADMKRIESMIQAKKSTIDNLRNRLSEQESNLADLESEYIATKNGIKRMVNSLNKGED